MQLKCNPILDRAEQAEFQLSGQLGRRLRAVINQWILPALDSNPAMLEMFRQRDVQPYRNLVQWAGEFAGKYLTHAVQILRLTNDEHLREHLRQFVAELTSCQAEDGYLGCWPTPFRMTNQAPNVYLRPLNWDTWAHYHIMLGLLLWHELEKDEVALQAAAQIGNLICDLYLNKHSPRLVDTGNTEMNLAPAHGLCLLYQRTGTSQYLAMAEQIVREFGAKDAEGNLLAGNYLDAPQNGQDFYQLPKPRWESLHPIMALAELYYLTDRKDCRRAFEALWNSIRRGDRHNNGGFSSGEKATGNPYAQGAIETCCTVAWMAMTVEMLRLTGDSTVADELEMSLLNSGMGLISESGRWVTYDTPMDGVRQASAHKIVFQSRPGSPELNCCSVNGPRVLGMVSEWALMRNASGLVLNYYGSGAISAILPSGNRIRITQKTEYPQSGVITIIVEPESPEVFSLSLRIPTWSKSTTIRVEDEDIDGIVPGHYFVLQRTWASPTKIQLELDFTLQFWNHPCPYPEHEDFGGQRPNYVSIYRGPLLLAYDILFNPERNNATEIPILSKPELTPEKFRGKTVFSGRDVQGDILRYCSFADAGSGGNYYQSWVPVGFACHPAAFSSANPRRSFPVKS